MLNKQLIIIRGPIGAGKTSVVEALRKAVGSVSTIDFDAFKRQIDSEQSSDWRRRIALDTALFLCQKLMDEQRTIIVDIHASHPDQLDAYLMLSKKNGYKAASFLLYPPLETCLERAMQRDVPGITYDIDEPMIRQYWEDVAMIDNERVFDDPNESPEQIADAILSSIMYK